MKKSTKGHPASGKRVSLNPIPFDEAVTDLLKVKPPPKERKSDASRKGKKQTAKRREKGK